MSLFVCPVCGGALTRSDAAGRYSCPKNHSFDIASEGYVNLLAANRRHSSSPGDDRSMAAARRAFLDKGYYSALRDALCEEIPARTPAAASILDAGCGEGYYTSGIRDALAASGRVGRIAGIDISKDILKYAARREKRSAPEHRIEYAVASSFHLPVADGAADILLDCFSPLALEEFRRVLRPGGWFVYVVPAAGHLWELKCAAYDSPYPNEEKDTPYDGFEYDAVRKVKTRITLASNDDIMNLFTMTPYFWRTPKEGVDRLRSLSSLETAAEFRIHIFKKR